MPSTDAFALQKSDLNGFLFADVGIESSGNTLSVLSAFARMDMDPWQEGSRLAKLPQLAAIDALAKLIAIMPSSPWSLTDATSIASRLVALLPRTVKTPATGFAAMDGANVSRTRVHFVIVIAMLASLVAGLILNFVTLGVDAQHGPRSAHAEADGRVSGAQSVVAPLSGYK